MDVQELNINNTTYDIKAKSVVDQNGGKLRFWTGTRTQYDAIATKDASTLYWVTDTKIIYLGDTAVGNFSSGRNIGEIVSSSLPLTDAGLHLLDGTRLSGDGIYGEFVQYIADLYNDTKVYNSSAFTIVGSPTITADGIASGFSSSNYITKAFTQVENNEVVFKIGFNLNNTTTGGTTNYSLFELLDTTTSQNTSIFAIRMNNVDKISLSQPSKFGTQWFKDIQPTNYSANALIELKLNRTTQTLSYKYYENDVLHTQGSTASTADWGVASLVQLGYRFNPFLGSIDLKQFSFAVDGVEVFSGSKPANYFTTESDWQSSVSTYGVCGKFVYNSVNNTVRLPKITGIVEGTTDVTALGDLIEAGLPNIEGYAGRIRALDYGQHGALTMTNTGNGNTGGGSNPHGTLSLNASLSNPIYGNSSTVQPQTIKVLYYIVIANSTKTDIQVDIDEIATDLNGKADVDLSNVPNSKGILTESYKNGSSWYRVYSDGWCEQGGKIICAGDAGALQTINLLKGYVDTNYNIQTSYTNPTSIGTDFAIMITDITTSSFKTSSWAQGTWYNVYCSWTTCGYIN